MRIFLFALFFIPFFTVCQDDEEFDKDEFYDSYNFLGFSADGFVAYELISFGQDEFGDNWEESELNIQDLKTDKVVWSSYDYDEKVLDDYGILIDNNIVFEASESYNSRYCNIPEYKKMEDRFYIEKNSKVLNLNNIETGAYFLDIFYDFQSDINGYCSAEMFEPPLYSKSHLVMGYRGGIGHSKYIGVLTSEECYEEFSYLGYYKSPFEMRIVLAFASSQTYNSYTSSTKYKFIGCSLNPSTFID